MIIDNDIVVYTMNKNEFSDFMDAFASFYEDRKVIRFKKDSLKMIKWLEARI